MPALVLREGKAPATGPRIDSQHNPRPRPPPPFKTPDSERNRIPRLQLKPVFTPLPRVVWVLETRGAALLSDGGGGGENPEGLGRRGT